MRSLLPAWRVGILLDHDSDAGPVKGADRPESGAMGPRRIRWLPPAAACCLTDRMLARRNYRRRVSACSQPASLRVAMSLNPQMANVRSNSARKDFR
jgi:hypothetical protein